MSICAAGPGRFLGVADQVDEDLPQPIAVHAQHHRRLREAGADHHLGFLQHWLEEHQGRLDLGAEVELLRLRLVRPRVVRAACRISRSMRSISWLVS